MATKWQISGYETVCNFMWIMKDLLKIFEERLNNFSEEEVRGLFDELKEFENVGPTMEDYMHFIEFSDNEAYYMSCAQSDDSYGECDNYDMAA